MNRKLSSKDEINKQFQDQLRKEGQTSLEGFLVDIGSRFIEEALESEVSDFLGRRRYERQKSEEEENFRGYRNGYQDYTVKTRSGRMRLKKPRVRETLERFESRIIERLDALEEDLKKIILEGYVNGLSTRDIEATFTDQDGKPLVSRTGTSEIVKTLYDEYEKFRNSDLSDLDVVYLYADGVYEAVKKYTNNQTLLCSWAILSNGKKVMLGLSAAASESEESWSAFFQEMQNRGLRQPLLIVSDGSKGIINGITRSFPQSNRQRCLAHKLRNIMAKVPHEFQQEVLSKVKSVYYSPDRTTAEILAEEFIKNYSNRFPSAVSCFVDDLDSCLTHLKFPACHHKYIRTTNLLERCFEEEKRRTKVFPQHQNERGALGLVFGVLIRASKRWKNIKMSGWELTLLKNMKSIICPNNNDLSKISFEKAA
jgi:transposase-like protein